MSEPITAETDEVCDFCLADITEGDTVYKVKSRMGHHLVCGMCNLMTPQLNP